jgi:hypothetical protein
MTPVGLDHARELGAREAGLAVVVTLRSDGWPRASVVNAGAVGGTQGEWGELDAAIVTERHAAVLVCASRIYSNPGTQLHGRCRTSRGAR